VIKVLLFLIHAAGILDSRNPLIKAHKLISRFGFNTSKIYRS